MRKPVIASEAKQSPLHLRPGLFRRIGPGLGHAVMWPLRMALVAAAGCIAMSAASAAQLLVSANDGKVLLQDGVVRHVGGRHDTVTVIDIGGESPKILAELAVPNSVLGPPSNVAISPDGSLVLVTSARIYDGDRPVPDDRLTFIDLRRLLAERAAPRGGDEAAVDAPPVATTLRVDKGPSGVAIEATGRFALVAHRDAGSVSLVDLARREVVSRLSLGDDKAGPTAVAFTPDGKRALVTLFGPGAAPTNTKVMVLRIRDGSLELTDRVMNTGFGPYGIDISPAGDIALVANLGGGVTGDADVVSVIDLTQDPVRVVNSLSVASSPEGMKLSPDAQYLAVASVNGSHKPRSSPFFRDGGLLQIYRREATSFAKVAEAGTGHWCQGAAWSRDSRQVYVQCMVEEEIEVFAFDPSAGLRPLPPLKLGAGPALPRHLVRPLTRAIDTELSSLRRDPGMQ
jgi:DNA-binding beta-propeller fold protein YncE